MECRLREKKVYESEERSFGQRNPDIYPNKHRALSMYVLFVLSTRRVSCWMVVNCVLVDSTYDKCTDFEFQSSERPDRMKSNRIESNRIKSHSTSTPYARSCESFCLALTPPFLLFTSVVVVGGGFCLYPMPCACWGEWDGHCAWLDRRLQTPTTTDNEQQYQQKQ